MMFKKLLTLRIPTGTPSLTTGGTLTSKVISRTLSEQKTESLEKWDVLSAVCVERHPVITKSQQDIEAKYHNLLRQIEYENSLLSDYEMQVKKQKKQMEKQKSVNTKTESVIDQTTRDFEDLSEQELANFKFASRINEAADDKLVFLNRKLDKHLMLVIEQQVGNANIWIPPQSERRNEETMIEAARRTVEELCGNDMKVKFYGNAPIGFCSFKYPKNAQKNGRAGAKIFYFLARYEKGGIPPNVKHCWLDREELKKTVHPKIHKSLSMFMIPD